LRPGLLSNEVMQNDTLSIKILYEFRARCEQQAGEETNIPGRHHLSRHQMISRAINSSISSSSSSTSRRRFFSDWREESGVIYAFNQSRNPMVFTSSKMFAIHSLHRNPCNHTTCTSDNPGLERTPRHIPH